MALFIFQVNPEREYRLSDALTAMTQRNEKILWLGPKPENNIELKVADMVYLWESASKRSDQPERQPERLVARGEVTQAPTLMDMPAWQRMFCVDKETRQSGAQFHGTGPRAEIRVEFVATKKVDRDGTNANPTLRKNSFLRKEPRGFYAKTIVRLTEPEARELDELAGWKPL